WRTHDHGVASRAAEGASEKVNGLVATASDEDCLRRNPVQLGEPFDQLAWLRLGVPVESRNGFIASRTPRQLIGVEALESGLPGGVLVSLQGHDVWAREFANP